MDTIKLDMVLTNAGFKLAKPGARYSYKDYRYTYDDITISILVAPGNVAWVRFISKANDHDKCKVYYQLKEAAANYMIGLEREITLIFSEGELPNRVQCDLAYLLSPTGSSPRELSGFYALEYISIVEKVKRLYRQFIFRVLLKLNRYTLV